MLASARSIAETVGRPVLVLKAGSRVVAATASSVRKPVAFNQFVDAVRQLRMYWLVLNERPPPGG